MPDRDLDIEIFDSTSGPFTDTSWRFAPEFTSSIDAAMLKTRPKWVLALKGAVGGWKANLSYAGHSSTATGLIAPLAVTAAALRLHALLLEAGIPPW